MSGRSRLGFDTNDYITGLTIPPEFSFAGRYLRTDGWVDPRSGHSPLLTVEEARWAAEHGLELLTYHQNGKSREVLGGYTAGREAGKTARTQQRDRGGAGKPIHPTVDFWPTPEEQDAMVPYFRGFRSVVGLERMGVYGPLPVVRRLFDEGLIRFAVQSVLGGYAAPVDPRATAVQLLNTDSPSTPAPNFGSRTYLAYLLALKDPFGSWRPEFA